MPIALILAGGSGERFWPASNKAKPKQFLPLTGNLPIIRETVERVKDLVELENIYVVTTKSQLPLVREVLSDLSADNIIVEPEGRNTAPCLLLSIAYIKSREGKDEVIAVLPSDHYIGDNNEFQKCLMRAYTVADMQQKIITFGIKPDRAETDYGYIAAGEEVEQGVFNGVKFVEKPDYKNAKTYLDEGYLWNSGIFVLNIEVFEETLKTYSSKLYKGYRKLEQAKNNDIITKIYKQLPKVSIDYALMESLPYFLVIPCNCGWDDLGSWRSLETIYSKNPHGNIIVGNAGLMEVSNCVVYSPDIQIVAIGIEDCIIAANENGVLICPKGRTKDLKQILNKLKVFNVNGVL